MGASLAADLRQFTGSETWTRHGLMRDLLMTEGVVYLADTAGAHWLTDVIASYQIEPRVRAEEFQVWKLVVAPDRSWVVTMTDGNTSTPIVTQTDAYTDFPLPEITIWLTDNTMLLPSEY